MNVPGDLRATLGSASGVKSLTLVTVKRGERPRSEPKRGVADVEHPPGEVLLLATVKSHAR